MLGNHTTEIKKAPTGARGAERAPVAAHARFREPGLNPFDVELHDLSSTGFRMVTFSRPRIGKHIWVSLPGLQPLEAIVRRADGNNFGCEFVHPLHPAVARHLQVKLR
ncbi:PilZ domain-containing protein [Sphingopyxis sp.]|uniref:PilZ domain-containing protein n=1 Tax=Sphingopyxis sp. TaxID=1908224 RepID=UPI002B4A26DC|nr:PilZ domain-containing protein [Sphingopyxis sp.]HJS13243.1 PilZ domain-containing protein [Sphingopyxis sp.]